MATQELFCLEHIGSYVLVTLQNALAKTHTCCGHNHKFRLLEHAHNLKLLLWTCSDDSTHVW